MYRVASDAFAWAQSLSDPQDAVTSVAVAVRPGDRTVLAVGSQDRQVRVYSLAGRRAELTQTLGNGASPVACVVLSTDGGVLVAAGWDKQVYIYRLVEEGYRSEQVLVVDLFPQALAIAAAGDVLAMGTQSGKVFIYALSTDGVAAASQPPLQITFHGINSVAFNADGKVLAVGSEWRLDLLTTLGPATFALNRTLDGFNAKINDVRFSPNGQRLVVGTDSGRVHLFIIRGSEVAPETVSLLLSLSCFIHLSLFFMFAPSLSQIQGCLHETTVQLWPALQDSAPARQVPTNCRRTANLAITTQTLSAKQQLRFCTPCALFPLSRIAGPCSGVIMHQVKNLHCEHRKEIKWTNLVMRTDPLCPTPSGQNGCAFCKHLPVGVRENPQGLVYVHLIEE